MSPSTSFALSDGRSFVSEEDPIIMGGRRTFNGLEHERDIVAEANDLWQRGLQAWEPQIERMGALELLYSGLHYENIATNRVLEVTNYPFSVVETIHPLLTEHRPMLQVAPAQPNMDSPRIRNISTFAEWWQRRARQMRTNRVVQRTKLKMGMGIYMLTLDYKTGMPYVVDWSPYDYIPDASARSPLWAEYHIFAAPFPTRRLRALFPHLKAADGTSRIKPDNYTSPSYEFNVRPWREFYLTGRARERYWATRATNPDSTAPYLGNQPTGVTSLVPYKGGTDEYGSDTTFVVQIVYRDYEPETAIYTGSFVGPDPTGGPPIRTPGIMTKQQPRSEVGWNVLQLTADGVILDHAPLDPAYQGLNFVMDLDYEHESRPWSFGEIDHLAPIVRAINERKNLLNADLRMQATPVLVATKGSGWDFSRGVVPGEAIEVSKGTEVHWLEYKGVPQHHFELLAIEQRDADVMSGVHDVTRGQRPTGLQTGVAIRELEASAESRIRGKVPGMIDAWWEVLTKACRLAGKKMTPGIFVSAPGSAAIPVSMADLDGEYDIVPALASATTASREEMEDKVLALVDRQLISPIDALQMLNVPGWPRLAVHLQEMMQAAAQNQAKKPSKEKAA